MRWHKYHARSCVVAGERFPSLAEGRRWQELLLLQRAGHIHSLQRQVRFPLRVDGQQIGAYVADFVYATEPGVALLETGAVPTKLHAATVVEDVKGCRTKLYRWKRRHFEVQYQHPIIEIEAR